MFTTAFLELLCVSEIFPHYRGHLHFDLRVILSSDPASGNQPVRSNPNYGSFFAVACPLPVYL